MSNRRQQKLEKESSEHSSQTSRDKNRSQVNFFSKIFLFI
jgi:hypothetical protein